MYAAACGEDDGTSGTSGTDGGTTTNTTRTTTTTTEAANCMTWWIGDSYCDAENNNAACDYDGGDCCEPHAHNWWNWYCRKTNVRFIKSKHFLNITVF